MKTYIGSYTTRKYSSVWILILMNLIPAYGVLFEGWKAFDVIFIYVLETIIVGLLNILKMAFSTTLQSGDSTDNKPESTIGIHLFKIFLIPFFIFHYFFFIAIQSIFIFVFLKHQNISDLSIIPLALWDMCINNKEISLSVISILGSHLYSFVSNYIGNKEYAKVGLPMLMVQPYIRIFIQQFVVIIGILMMSIFNTPNTFVILLVIFKIIADAFMHIRVHQKYES